MTDFNLDTIFVRNQELIYSDMHGDYVMLDMQRGVYCGIGGVGSRIWEILQHPATGREICRVICAEYEVAEDKCQADIMSYLTRLLMNQVVHVHEGAQS